MPTRIGWTSATRTWPASNPGSGGARWFNVRRNKAAPPLPRPERGLQRLAQGSDHRRQSEQQRGENAQRGREKQNARIHCNRQCDRVGPRREQRNQKLTAPTGEQEAQRGASGGEHEAFG